MRSRSLYPQEMLKIYEARQNGPVSFTSEQYPDVTIVLLSLERVDLTRRCIESCLKNAGCPFKMLIFDNGSSPSVLNQIQRLADQYPQIRVVAVGENLGVAGGRNRAFSLVDTPYILSLDNDTIGHPNFLVQALRIALHYDVPFVSPMRLAPNGTVQGLGMELALTETTGTIRLLRWFHNLAPSAVTAWLAGGEFQTNYVSGGMTLMKRQAFWDCGGFADLPAGMSMEDVDLSIRLTQKGYQVWTAHRSMITHDDEWLPQNEAEVHYALLRYDTERLKQSNAFILARHGKDAVSAALAQNMQARLASKLSAPWRKAGADQD